MSSHNPEKTTTFSPMNSSQSLPQLSHSTKIQSHLFQKPNQQTSRVTEETLRTETDEKKDKSGDKEEVVEEQVEQIMA